jgi:hypothetical protein
MSFPRKPDNIITPILFAMIQRQCCSGNVSLILNIRTFEDILTFPMGVVSGFRFFLQNNLSLSSRNFALVNGEHIGSRTENELNRHNYEI